MVRGSEVLGVFGGVFCSSLIVLARMRARISLGLLRGTSWTMRVRVLRVVLAGP